MRVFYGKYDKLDEVAAGASFYYYEISKLLNQKNDYGIETIPIGQKELISANFLSGLKEDDVIIPNIGPYAWFYYYLRAKKRLKFRIIHDVQTALFADHLLQEQLCSDFMREGDAVLFLSQYQKYLYMSLFPYSLDNSNTFVCNPVLNFLPTPKTREKRNSLTLGWFGRVFDAKNFGQALEIFIKFYKYSKCNVKMLICGLADEKYKPSNVEKILQKNNIDVSKYHHVNNGGFVEHSKMLSLLHDADVLLFPSVGNMESFGRVMLEANNFDVKVIAAKHGASQELIPESSLLDVDYCYHKHIDLNSNQSMGQISVDEAVGLLQNNDKLKLGDNSYYKNHDKKLFNIILNKQPKDNLNVSKEVKDFVSRVNLFINPDFHEDKHSLLEKSSSMLMQILSNEFDIVKNSLAIRDNVNYKPYMTLIKQA